MNQQASTLVILSALTRPLLLGSALVVAIFASNVRAQPQSTVFMLQFGSFETKQEAEQKIKAIGTKHSGMLAKYPAMIREITMPPDNLTVYRTQAGPAKTREDAQSVCAQLASQGDECYVVETAMVIPGAAPAVQQAGIVPTGVEEKIIPTKDRPTPSRDPDNIKAIEQVAKPIAESDKTDMLKTMDEAVRAPAIRTAAPAPAAKIAKVDEQEEEGSFWSWLGGDDDEEEDADDAWAKRKLEAEKRAQEAAAATRAAPVDEVATGEMMAPPAPIAVPTPTIPAPVPEATPVEIVEPQMAATAPNQFAPPAPVMAPVSETPVEPQPMMAPLAPADAQLGSQGLKLPPPPPPTALARAQMMRGDTVPPVAPIEAQPVAPLQTGPAPVLAAPSVPESTGSIVTSELPAVPFKKGVSVPSGGGEVQVGEAQRVPLTENQQQKPLEQPVAKIVGVNEAPEVADNVPPPVPATPVAPASSVAPQKTLWAHIHYFPDQQAALSFWDGYRKAHPDFPVVRVRTTSSLIAQQQGDMRVALRIGPFAQQGFINILCNSITDQYDNIACGAITDMGASSNAYSPRDRYAQAVAQSARYANLTATKSEGFWVQLGSYPSMAEAESAWQDARTQHASALDAMKPAILSPDQGSQAQPVFRLRTGPFASQMAAKDVCSRVKVNSGACLVVSD